MTKSDKKNAWWSCLSYNFFFSPFIDISEKAQKRAISKFPSDPSILAPGGSNQVVRGKLSVTENPIAEVTVAAACRVQGFLRVSENDIVTIMEATNPEPGIVYARGNDGVVGRLPQAAVHIDIHTSNLYLEALRVAVKSPVVLWDAMLRQVVSASELRDMLLVTGLLYDGLVGLFQQESDRHPHETEFLRDCSPATSLAGVILQSDAATKWLARVVTEARLQHTAKHSEEHSTAESLLNGVQVLIATLLQRTTDIPNEVALTLKALRHVSSPRIAASFFCLRFLGPSLIQSKSMVQLAKALQLVANGVDPAEESPMFVIREGLQLLQPSLEQFVDSVSLCSSSFYHCVPYPLVQSAASLYANIYGRTSNTLITPDTIAKAENSLRPYIQNE